MSITIHHPNYIATGVSTSPLVIQPFNCRSLYHNDRGNSIDNLQGVKSTLESYLAKVARKRQEQGEKIVAR